MDSTDKGNRGPLGAQRLQDLTSASGEVVGFLIHTGKWKISHQPIMLAHAGQADIVYTRWSDGDYEFPFSPYDRVLHLQGMDFVGTDVMVAPDILRQYAEIRLTGGSSRAALRELARAGASFLAVDAVTYEKAGYAS